MDPIRIHLGQMPSMLTAIVDDLLARESDIVVVGRSDDGADPLRQAQENRADMLITQDRHGSGGTCLDILLSAAPLNVLAISRDGTNGSAISLERRPVDLGTNGGATLADAIRGLAAKS